MLIVFKDHLRINLVINRIDKVASLRLYNSSERGRVLADLVCLNRNICFGQKLFRPGEAENRFLSRPFK